MKDYIWLIVTGVCALLAFIFFLITISNSTSLIKKLKKSKWHVMLNVLVLTIGIGNVAIAIYLLQDIRKQIEMFTNI